MSDFFHGWRRKVGCATLTLALVFIAGWVRSYHYSDQLSLPSIHPRLEGCLQALNGTFRWIQFADAEPSGWIVSLSSEFEGNEMIPENIPWKTRFMGLHFGNHGDPQATSWTTNNIWCCSYLTLAVPMTLLSAFLLLSKPCIAKPKTIIENSVRD